MWCFRKEKALFGDKWAFQVQPSGLPGACKAGGTGSPTDSCRSQKHLAYMLGFFLLCFSPFSSTRSAIFFFLLTDGFT